MKKIDMSKVYSSAASHKQALRLVCDYIEADKLKDNPENELIYGKLDVEDLIPEIVRSGGIKEPIEVAKRADGLYIISGHKRKLATLTAFERGLLPTKKVPYFISEFKNEQEEQLALIGRNTQRHKTAEMRLNEINYVTQLLGKEKDAKKGGFRKRIADYFGISETEVQRYWSYDKLISPIKEAVQNGLSFSVAVEFSTLDDKQQKFAFNELKKNNKLMTKYVREIKKTIKEDIKEKEDEKKESSIPQYESHPKSKPELKPVATQESEKNIDTVDEVNDADEFKIDTPKEKSQEGSKFQNEIQDRKVNIEKDAIEFCIDFLKAKKEELMNNADDKNGQLTARQHYIDKIISNCQKDLNI